MKINESLEKALALPKGQYLDDIAIRVLATSSDTQTLMRVASEIRDRGFQNAVSYSRKVFIPLTHLCRDVCHYCTFAQVPRKLKAPYMLPEEILKIASVENQALGSTF